MWKVLEKKCQIRSEMDKVFPQPGPGKGCDHLLATYALHTATPGMTGEECDKKNLDIQMVKIKETWQYIIFTCPC